MTTPNLGLEQILSAQAQKEVPINRAIELIDALIQLSVISRTTNAPPVSPAAGDAYIVGSAPTGAWAGRSGQIAVWLSSLAAPELGSWAFVTAKNGWRAWVDAETRLYRFDGSFSPGQWLATSETGLIAIERPYRGCRATMSVDLTGLNTTAGYVVPWNAEARDTDAIHDTVTNNSRLTVPAGVTKVRLSFNLYCANISTGGNLSARINKNGAAFDGMAQELAGTAGNTFWAAQGTSDVLDVVAGDYFEVQAIASTDTAIDFIAARSWFAMEIVETASSALPGGEPVTTDTSAGRTFTTADHRGVFRRSNGSPMTDSLPTPGTGAGQAPNGWWAKIWNVGATALTLDPSGAVTINGAANQAISAGELWQVWSDGTAYVAARLS